MVRKCGFSVRLEGMGGRAVVVPIAREGVGGSVGRKVRMWVPAGEVGNEYCEAGR